MVADLQIGLEVLVTRSGAGKRGLINANLTAPTTRAEAVHLLHDVIIAAHVAEILRHTTTQTQATVACPGDLHDLARFTGRAECLRLAVLLCPCKNKKNTSN